jgi:hypothetical protein
MQRVLRRFAPLALFALITLLACWKPIFHGEFTLVAGSDLARAYYPYFDVAAYWLKKGVFVLWDPYVYAGKANMGEPQPGLYYPLNWLFMLLPARDGGMNPDGLQALLIVHFLLAGYFFYLLARSFGIGAAASTASGAAFAFGGYTVQLYGYVNKFSGFVWLPLALLFFRRALQPEPGRSRTKPIVASGVALALTFLPGHHIPALHTGLLLALYAVFRAVAAWREESWRGALRTAASLAAVAGIAALLTAVQWLPSAEWARAVYRWTGDGPPLVWGQKVPYSSLGRTGNISPQDALSLLLPYVSTSANLYVGPAVLFLALTGALFGRGRDAAFFAAAAIVYFFTSWGRFSIVHGWLNTLVAGMWFAREVFHYLVPLEACLALLAGFGLDRLAEGFSIAPQPAIALWVRRAGWGLALVVFGALGLTAAVHLVRMVPLDDSYLTGLGALASYAAVLGFLLFLVYTGRMKAREFQLAVVALIVVDLTSEFSRRVPAKAGVEGAENTYLRVFWKKPAAANFLLERRKEEAFRVDDPDNLLPHNFGDVWRLESTMGHGATALVDYFALRGTGWGPASNASALLSVRYFPSRTPIPGMEKVSDDGPVFRNPRALPKAWAAPRARTFANDAELLLWLQSPLFDPREEILLRDIDSAPVGPLRVKILRSRTAGERKAALLPPQSEERRMLEVYHPAWGWGTGDEVLVAITAAGPVEHCWLSIDYRAGTASHSKLQAEWTAPSGSNRFDIELPAAGPSATIDLGPLAQGEYRLLLEKTDACSATLERIRITADPPGPPQRSGTVDVRVFEPNRLAADANLEREGFAVFSEVFYPGWEATVDGRPARVLRADHCLRAVAVPAGAHRIELRFRSTTFRIGLTVTLVSAALAAAFLALPRRRDVA